MSLPPTQRLVEIWWNNLSDRHGASYADIIGITSLFPPTLPPPFHHPCLPPPLYPPMVEAVGGPLGGPSRFHQPEGEPRNFKRMSK
jgi:hypothetical protein